MPADVFVYWRDHDNPLEKEVLVGATKSAQDGTWRIMGLNYNLQYVIRARAQGYDDATVVGARPSRSDVIAYADHLEPTEDFDGLTGHVLLDSGLPPFTCEVIQPLPYGLNARVDGRKLLIEGVSTDSGLWDSVVRVTASNAVWVDVPVQVQIQVLSDPHWDKVVSLLHFDGPDGSTTFTDETEKVWARAGSVEIDTSHPKFGAGAGLFSGGYLHCTGGADFSFGTNDFTLELFLRGTQFGATSAPTYFDNRFGAYGSDLVLYTPNAANYMVFFAAGANRIITASISNGEFHHIALCRGSGVTRLFVNGVQSGADYVDTNNYTSSSFRLGANLAGGSGLAGHLDEFRITKGVARYAENFPSPTKPFLSR